MEELFAHPRGAAPPTPPRSSDPVLPLGTCATQPSAPPVTWRCGTRCLSQGLSVIGGRTLLSGYTGSRPINMCSMRSKVCGGKHSRPLTRFPASTAHTFLCPMTSPEDTEQVAVKSAPCRQAARPSAPHPSAPRSCPESCRHFFWC